MKKALLMFLVALLPCCIYAQEQAAVTPVAVSVPATTFKFGHFSYSAVIGSMPDNAIIRQSLDTLRAKYDAETRRAENEFNTKYEEFLEGQRDFAPIILQKRQAELQDMLKKNVAFKAEASRLLKQAERDAYAPLRSKLNVALQRVGREKGLAFIINTDNDTCPFIDPTMGEDLTDLLKEYTR